MCSKSRTSQLEHRFVTVAPVLLICQGFARILSGCCADGIVLLFVAGGEDGCWWDSVSFTVVASSDGERDLVGGAYGCAVADVAVVSAVGCGVATVA